MAKIDGVGAISEVGAYKLGVETGRVGSAG